MENLNEREKMLIRDALLSHVSDLTRLSRDSFYWDSYLKEIKALFEKLYPFERFDPRFIASGAGY